MSLDLNATKVSVATDLQILTKTGNPSNFTVTKVTDPVALSGTTPPTGSAGTVTGSGTSALSYGQVSGAQLNTVGIYTFTYNVTNLSGVSYSTPQTATVNVKPVANDVTVASGRQSTTARTLDVRASNIPSAALAGLTYVVDSAPTCITGGTAQVTASGDTFSFKTTAWPAGKSGNCTFTYHTVWTSGGKSLSSAVKTITVPVTS